MAKKHYFFDFDETLVDTSKLVPYRQTKEGRQYVADYPEQVETHLIDKRFVPLVNRFAKSNQISITTNSAKPYTKALLQKHGFPDIPIYDNLHKPCHDKLKLVIREQCQSKGMALAIGDSASDILAAHGCSIPSVAVTWGKTSTIEQLRKAEPSQIVSNFDELEESIKVFANDDLPYQSRTEPDQYVFLPSDSYNNLENPDIEIYALGNYYPIGHEDFNGSQSNEILRFKEMKNVSRNKINENAFTTFFHNGALKRGLVFYNVFFDFYYEILNKIDSINLCGNSFVITAPNSAPEYCYKTDINQIMVDRINREKFDVGEDYLHRYIFRVFPKRESRLHGERNEEVHYKTIGIKEPDFLPENLDNLLIFDDITTSGSQLYSIASLIREICNFNGNIHGIVLGQTSRYARTHSAHYQMSLLC